MKTALFWFIWGILSFWALSTFYFSFAKKKLELLRNAAFLCNLAVLILTFFPWRAPLSFRLLLGVSCILFMTRKDVFLKIGSVATVVNTVILFVIMYRFRPGTFMITWYDVPPIIAILLLLINDVIVLLLWQQLKLRKKR